MAERILLLSVPHGARLSSIRASAFTLCSYIEGLTGSGAAATVKTRSSCATARLRVGVRPAKRVIMGRPSPSSLSSPSVIARSAATKQSSFLVAAKEAGLLRRFARNDGDYVLPTCFAITGK